MPILSLLHSDGKPRGQGADLQEPRLWKRELPAVQGEQPRATEVRRGGEDRGHQEGDRGEADRGHDQGVLEVQQEGDVCLEIRGFTLYFLLFSFSKRKVATR